MINYKIRSKIEVDSFDWLLEFISQYTSMEQPAEKMAILF